MKLSKCIHESFTPLLCAGGICGANIKSERECPAACESLKMCSQCLANAQCGWCEEETGNGAGKCVEGSVDGVPEKCKENSWNYLKCPTEDECENGHHNCDNLSEKCVDLHEGFKCICAEGYLSDDDNGECLPICTQGCVHGTCASPDDCKCDFGYVGTNCSTACQCSGHSDCAGPDQLDTCLKCMNNTRGERCEKCEKFNVKRDDGRCESCTSFCHGHTNICVRTNETSDDLETIFEGPNVDEAICLNCGNFTSDQRCDNCIKGEIF